MRLRSHAAALFAVPLLLSRCTGGGSAKPSSASNTAGKDGSGGSPAAGGDVGGSVAGETTSSGGAHVGNNAGAAAFPTGRRATDVPTIPVGLDAYRMWDRLPDIRIGQRAY